MLAGNAGDDRLDGGTGNDALIDGLGSDRLFGGAGNDWFFATQAQLLGGSGNRHRPFRRRRRLRYARALLLDQATLAVEQADVAQTSFRGMPSRSAAWTSRSPGLSGSCSRPSSASTTCRCPAATLARGFTRPTCSVCLGSPVAPIPSVTAIAAGASGRWRRAWAYHGELSIAHAARARRHAHPWRCGRARTLRGSGLRPNSGNFHRVGGIRSVPTSYVTVGGPPWCAD